MTRLGTARSHCCTGDGSNLDVLGTGCHSHSSSSPGRHGWSAGPTLCFGRSPRWSAQVSKECTRKTDIFITRLIDPSTIETNMKRYDYSRYDKVVSSKKKSMGNIYRLWIKSAPKLYQVLEWVRKSAPNCLSSTAHCQSSRASD